MIWFEFGVDFLALIRIDQILNNGGSVKYLTIVMSMAISIGQFYIRLTDWSKNYAGFEILALNSLAPNLFEFLANENVAF